MLRKTASERFLLLLIFIPMQFQMVTPQLHFSKEENSNWLSMCLILKEKIMSN